MNLDLLRAFFEIAEQGSLNKAAERRRVSQSTLTRQMHALEQEVGGKLLERSPSGVALTGTGHALLEGMRPVLDRFDAALGEARKLARGQSASLRIGYLLSAGPDYLHPALTALRRTHPEVKVKLLDLSPGEQIVALRKGELDIALIGYAGSFLSKEFYVRKIAALPVLAALPEQHPLALKPSLRVAELRGEIFIGAPERDMPGHNRWISQLCKRAGFHARFLEEADSLTQGLAAVVTESAVAFIPDYAKKITVPGIALRPLTDSGVKWDLLVAWQRGKIASPVRALLDSLPQSRVVLA